MHAVLGLPRIVLSGSRRVFHAPGIIIGDTYDVLDTYLKHCRGGLFVGDSVERHKTKEVA